MNVFLTNWEVLLGTAQVAHFRDGKLTVYARAGDGK
jgi:hypothetical protein